MEDWERPLDRQRSRRSGHGWVIALALTIGGVVAAGLIWHFREDLRTLFSSLSQDSVDAGAVATDSGVEQKSLAEGDGLIRKIGATISNSPMVASWLSAEGILQRIAAAVNLVARGDSPRTVLSFIEFEDEFAVEEHVVKPKKRGKKRRGKKAPAFNERIYIAKESYARYDRFMTVFTPPNGEAAGRAYAELRPYFDSAFAQVASPGERFDDVLVKALKRLSSVNVPQDKIELVPKGAIYAFKDPALESLSAADKHVIRMGPKNAKGFQDALRAFAAAASLSLEEPAPK